MALSDHLHAKDWTFSATSHTAQRRKEFALYILIASLGMFFTAALLGYLLIRLRAENPPPLHLPPILWLSTGFAIVGSAFLWRALRSVQRERQPRFRKQLLTAFLFGIGFCLSQSVGLTGLLREHLAVMKERPPVVEAPETAEASPPKIIVPQLAPNPHFDLPPMESPFPVRSKPSAPIRPTNHLEGLLFVLVLLHILHFVAGMIGLSIVTVRGLKGRYDHEYHSGVRLCAVYWRFLDVVWVILFAAFLLTS